MSIPVSEPVSVLGAFQKAPHMSTFQMCQDLIKKFVSDRATASRLEDTHTAVGVSANSAGTVVGDA